MSYKHISGSPKTQTDQHDQLQREAFLEAFNNIYEPHRADQSGTCAVAHNAAKPARKTEGVA
jgi:cation transport regulator ChaB